MCPFLTSDLQLNMNHSNSPYGELVTLTCITGYIFPDKTWHKIVECLDSGMWNVTMPDLTCQSEKFNCLHVLVFLSISFNPSE